MEIVLGLALCVKCICIYGPLQLVVISEPVISSCSCVCVHMCDFLQSEQR